MKMRLKVSSVKWQPLNLGSNVSKQMFHNEKQTVGVFVRLSDHMWIDSYPFMTIKHKLFHTS